MVAAILAFGAVCAGILKVGFGQGAGILALPLYTLVVSPRFANGVLAPLLLGGDMFSLRAYWRQWEARLLPILMPGQIAGVVLGAYALARLPEVAARRAIGALLVAVVLFQFLARRRSREEAPEDSRPRASIPGAAAISLLAGFASALAQLGSGFLAVYLVRRRTAKHALVPTLNITFFFSNLVKVFLYSRYGIITSSTWIADAWLVPALVLGGFIGVALNRRANQQLFESIVLGFALLAGLKLVMS